MNRCIVFGIGFYGEITINHLRIMGIEPIALVDNSEKKWGKTFEGLMVHPPQYINDCVFDYIIIASQNYFEEIKLQLTNEYHIDDRKIKHFDFFLRQEFINYYKPQYSSLTHEQKSIFDDAINNEQLPIFENRIQNKFKEHDIVIETDNTGMFYTFLNGKKMFLSRTIKTIDMAKEYVRGLLIEQSEESPHCYLKSKDNMAGKVVLDAGVAEGNFSLEIIDIVEKVILVEPDSTWIEAISKTFEPYKDKMVVCNKYLSESSDFNNVTIDELSAKYDIDFVKMDIEGAELSALRGAKETIENQRIKEWAVCVYHNHNDESKVRSILQGNYQVTVNDGYMVFPYNKNQLARMVRGVLRAN